MELYQFEWSRDSDVCMYGEQRNKRGNNKEKEFVLMSTVCFLSVNETMCTRVIVVPQTNKTKRHKYDGNSLVYTSHSSPSMCLSVILSFQKSSCSWPTFLKNTLALKIASSLHSWHVRKRVIFPHWWFDWKNTTGSRTSRTGGLRERDGERKRERGREANV